MFRLATFGVVCVIFSTVRGTSLDINDTQLAQWPPLYAMDDWYQCQRPGDVYCMVDAALFADEDTPMLAQLQEYSLERLKHYNRTQVHRGVCVTRCAGARGAPWLDAAASCLDDSLRPYNLQARVLSVDWCTPTSGAGGEGSWGSRALAAFCVALLAMALLATMLHVLGDRCASVEGNKYLLAFSMKRNWEILTYDRSKPRSDDRMKDLTAIEGIRFVGMQCVIFSHVLLINIYSYTDNPQYVERMYSQFGWQMVMNSPLWLQAFFAMSAFLTTYAVLITADNSPITLFKCFMGVVNRWIRMTPVAGVAMWFTTSWYAQLGGGPQWAWLVAREAADCSARGWLHLLYVHNHLRTGKFCMGHTWYLAADMQLHIIGLLVLLVLMRWRRAAAPVLAAMFLGSALTAGLVTYFYNLTPIVTGQSPETLRTMFAGSRELSLLYLPSWMNLAGYSAGMATAFLLHYVREAGLKLEHNKWFLAAFHGSLHLAGALVAAGVVFLRGSPPRWAAALYAALDRPMVALCFCLFMLGCFLRCHSALRSALEWRGFHLLGRLSYSVFVIHFIVLRLTLAGNTQLAHVSLIGMITLLISVSVLSYAAALPYCLLVELPAIELWRALTAPRRRDRAGAPPMDPPMDAPPAKPLDLVASITRRADV